MRESVLAVRGLTRRFGGLMAVMDVSLDLEMGQIHAVIGPNGAGKSTLVNMLAGELRPNSGSVELDGHAIAGMPAHRVARLGVSRTFQHSNLFREMSASENCRLAAQARRQRAWALHERAAACRFSSDAASRALAQVDLDSRAEVPPVALSHGERRALEIALCLAMEPRVLLLDEPLAGMGAEESQRVLALLRGLKPDHAILLVEHDMDAVFALADTITVMVNGQVLESGAPAQIRASAAVREAYLGDGANVNTTRRT